MPRTRLRGPVPWVIAIMVALVAIALAGGLALGQLADRARADLAGGATVQVLEADPASRARQAGAAAALLRGDSSVAAVRIVPEAELDALLEPWLGSRAGGEAVPVPALIDLRLDGEADPRTLARLQAALEKVAPDARIDAQAAWLAPVFDAIESLRWLAAALAVLLAITGAAAVWLASRAALESNRRTVEVVHLLGGTDGQIARIVQRAIAIDAAIGGAVGLAIGLAVVLLLRGRFAALGGGLGGGMGGGAGLEPVDWLILALVPVVATGLAVATARVTVLATLRRML